MKSIIMRIILFTMSLVFLSSSPGYSATERRIDPVIGNGAYETGHLKNPVNKATDMAATLATTPAKTMVLKYSDFGPQGMSWEIIGFYWWQWVGCPCSEPGDMTEYDVKVVVYRDIPLRQVKKTYPVLKEKGQDFRYLPYTKAMNYLDKQIQENIMADVTQTLQQTKSLIEKGMGKPKKAINGN
jgi:hypothetical protein